MAFGKSYIISLVFSWLLPKGLTWIENYAEQHKQELREFIESIVPGSLFDQIAWDFVSGNLPLLFEIARNLLGTQGTPKDMNVAVAECVGQCKDQLGDVA